MVCNIYIYIDSSYANMANVSISVIYVCDTIYIYIISLIEGNLEVTLPTIWRDGKAAVGRVSEEKSRSEKIGEEKE